MESYSVDFSRTLWASYLMIIAVIVAILVNPILSQLIATAELTSESPISLVAVFPVDAITAPFVFSMLYGVFSRWAWRAPIVNKIVPVPNFRGTWEGKLHSSHDSGLTESGTLTIDQTWSQIEILLEIEGAYSESKTVSLRTNKAYPELVFTYQSHPIGDGSADRDTHRGTNRLVLKENKNGELVLKGDYYTAQQRNTHGEMEFILSNRKTSITSIIE